MRRPGAASPWKSPGAKSRQGFSILNVSILDRCAAQTPAVAGFLQTFDPIRGGLCPFELPLLSGGTFRER